MTKEAVVKDARAGLTLKALARKYRLSPICVWRWLDEARVPVPNDERDSAIIAAYRDQSAITMRELSQLFDVPFPHVVYLVARSKNAVAGVRTRGSRRAQAPSARHLAILEMAKTMTYEAVGQKFNLSKQSIFKVMQRWGQWTPPTEILFQPGDVITRDGSMYTVVEAGPAQGTVRGPHPSHKLVTMKFTATYMPVRLGSENGVLPNTSKANGSP